jgi:hypothetical protein
VKGRSTARRVSLLVLTAILGAALLVEVGSASADQGKSFAVAAKKKCKKKKHRSASTAKKKCKKKKATPVVTPPAPPTPPSPTLRVTLTWDTTADLDLLVWAPDGTLAFVWSSPNPIPGTQFSSDDTSGFGPETMTDLQVPNRQFSYGICVADDDGLDGTIGTLQYRRADGTNGSVSTSSGDLDDNGDGIYVAPAGSYNPGGDPNPCI